MYYIWNRVIPILGNLCQIPARRQIIGDDSDEWTTESEYTASEEEIEEELHIAPKTVHFSNKKDVTAIVHRSPSPSNVSKTQTLKEETKPMNAPQSSSQLFERDDDLFKKYFEAKYLCPSTNVVMQDTTSTKLPDSVLTSDLCESAPPLPHQDISSVLSFESVDVFKKDSELCTVEKIFEDGVDNRSIITAPDYTTHPTPFLQVSQIFLIIICIDEQTFYIFCALLFGG